ncbi:nucleotidyltransferase family protein [Capillimicrobium parvum]|uniref:Nicotine blue oxidoreductase n=1 Tax=Capillimicrobium parvum TaxID=2884022 RepID=A0A9E6XT41_9ACTN|nr:nucleotidyltransferase family protein [Capillimicrobium parvum]UGS34046.1 Nicotine blue oxidoreductase [Capillimicrobium parvum]
MDVCGAVLAAGAGRRFGAVKQLAPLGGRPLVQWAVDAACAAQALDEVVVVVGAHGDEVRGAIRPGRARVVSCAGWEEGLAASLRCAAGAAGDAAWLVVTLGDEPRMTAAAIDAVVAAARSAPADVAAVRGRWGERPGHPVALRRELLHAVGELRGDAGARELLARHVVLEVECGPAEASVDVDTPEDLRGLTS